MTPLSKKIEHELELEFERMANEWFFPWHHIGGSVVVEIDGFNGRNIKFSGIKYSGSAIEVYWATIQRYLKKKIMSVWEKAEIASVVYPANIRVACISEVAIILKSFAMKIKTYSIEKDNILKGNLKNRFQISYPASWEGSQNYDIEDFSENLISIINAQLIDSNLEGSKMLGLPEESLTLKKTNKEESIIRGTVSKDFIATSNIKNLIEIGDIIERILPNGHIEILYVLEATFYSRMHGIPEHYQIKFSKNRSDLMPNIPINAHFHGANSRINILSNDNSVNSVNTITDHKIANLVSQIHENLNSLPPNLVVPITKEIEELKNVNTSIEGGSDRISKILGSIKEICEGAAGNIIAAGIISLISQML